MEFKKNNGNFKKIMGILKKILGISENNGNFTK
jgi:hypothetical protein